ncbi:hypothetical protein PPTG_24829 [Phytophthora nicotianae INRA-310]|uniref:Uncharacterized protein n=1 Tax=Phytophthora nicotianae (strain INRA-310) TaxID=761204 RepID=W2PCR3_PHYN3|nr:hypothetical protein PPTG_24829 [Phytophthora nicotianae INRA-310]ETM97784.1 hypothetical protein PPTG_24829 [Phytophthora nicotianae INRA-310]
MPSQPKNRQEAKSTYVRLTIRPTSTMAISCVNFVNSDDLLVPPSWICRGNLYLWSLVINLSLLVVPW